ncbi:SU10 major capsid protein [Peribacillus loiseleuriae]|uniref:SU10 major capsid protein n=1 Tax=Peribacillus loiseleuriae TaxID=1679170 RepID=UPI003D0910EB
MTFTTENFVPGQSFDIKDTLILANPKISAFSTFALGKAVPAKNPTVKWIEETINETSAVTMKEGGDSPNHVNDDADLMENYLELFGATAQVSNTAQASEAIGIEDLISKDMAAKTEAIKRRIEQKFLYGVKGFTAGKYETAGIFNLVNSSNAIEDKTASISPAMFEILISKVYDAGVSYNLVAFMNAHTKQMINQFANVTYLGKDKFQGMDTSVYSTAFGDVSFIDTPAMKTKDILILNPDFIETSVLIPFTGTVQGANGSKKSVYLETQLGIKLLNSKAAATLTFKTAD